jgi:hypothetical protein
VRNHPQRTVVPSLTALLTTVCVSNGVHNAVDTPHRTENRCSNRPSQTRDQQCADDGWVILAEVLVCALRRVERKHGLLRRGRCSLDLLVGRVFEGVGDLGRLAERADAATVPGADEEGADDSTEDVAGSR